MAASFVVPSVSHMDTPDFDSLVEKGEKRGLTPFQIAVYAITALIPSGRVATYKTIAALLHCGSTQAVGTALKNNPYAPSVPCHRVVSTGKNGHVSLGGFSGSRQESGHDNISRKLKILQGEGVTFNPRTLTLDDACTKAVIFPDDFDPKAVKAILSYLYKGKDVDAATEVDEDHAYEQTSTPSKSVSGVKRARKAISKGAPSSEETEEGVRAGLSRSGATGREVRLACRSGVLKGHTSGLAPGYAQANLVIVPKEHAFNFLLYCTRNPKPCPLLEVTDIGSWEAATIAPGSDIRTDLPQYRVYRNGVLSDTCESILHLWPGKDVKSRDKDARNDWVGFLLGCSFSFEEALLEGGVRVRHLQQEKSGELAYDSKKRPCLAVDPKNVPMYKTCVPTAAAGPFKGPLVVSMRPMESTDVKKAYAITEEFPRVHGRPVFHGNPGRIGISNVTCPDFGDGVTILPGEEPVFWACGVTPQAALLEAKIPIAITHAPGHMFVSDKLNSELAGFSELDVSPYLKK